VFLRTGLFNCRQTDAPDEWYASCVCNLFGGIWRNPDFAMGRLSTGAPFQFSRPFDPYGRALPDPISRANPHSYRLMLGQLPGKRLIGHNYTDHWSCKT